MEASPAPSSECAPHKDTPPYAHPAAAAAPAASLPPPPLLLQLTCCGCRRLFTCTGDSQADPFLDASIVETACTRRPQSTRTRSPVRTDTAAVRRSVQQAVLAAEDRQRTREQCVAQLLALHARGAAPSVMHNAVTAKDDAAATAAPAELILAGALSTAAGVYHPLTPLPFSRAPQAGSAPGSSCPVSPATTASVASCAYAADCALDLTADGVEAPTAQADADERTTRRYPYTPAQLISCLPQGIFPALAWMREPQVTEWKDAVHERMLPTPPARGIATFVDSLQRSYQPALAASPADHRLFTVLQSGSVDFTESTADARAGRSSAVSACPFAFRLESIRSSAAWSSAPSRAPSSLRPPPPSAPSSPQGTAVERVHENVMRLVVHQCLASLPCTPSCASIVEDQPVTPRVSMPLCPQCWARVALPAAQMSTRHAVEDAEAVATCLPLSPTSAASAYKPSSPLASKRQAALHCPSAETSTRRGEDSAALSGQVSSRSQHTTELRVRVRVPLDVAPLQAPVRLLQSHGTAHLPSVLDGLDSDGSDDSTYECEERKDTDEGGLPQQPAGCREDGDTSAPPGQSGRVYADAEDAETELLDLQRKYDAVQRELADTRSVLAALTDSLQQQEASLRAAKRRENAYTADVTAQRAREAQSRLQLTRDTQSSLRVVRHMPIEAWVLPVDAIRRPAGGWAPMSSAHGRSPARAAAGSSASDESRGTAPAAVDLLSSFAPCFGTIAGLRLGLLLPGGTAPTAAAVADDRDGAAGCAQATEWRVWRAATRRQRLYSQCLLSGTTDSPDHAAVAPLVEERTGRHAVAAAASTGGPSLVAMAVPTYGLARVDERVSPAEVNVACGYLARLLVRLATRQRHRFTAARFHLRGERTTIDVLERQHPQSGALPAGSLANRTREVGSSASSLFSATSLLARFMGTEPQPTSGDSGEDGGEEGRALSPTRRHRAVVRATVDFFLSERLFAWRTFGEACEVVADCVCELCDLLHRGLKCQQRRQQLIGQAARSVEDNDAADDAASRSSSLLQSESPLQGCVPPLRPPFVIANHKIDGFPVAHGRVSDAVWTLSMRKLLANVQWCVDSAALLHAQEAQEQAA